MIKSSSEKIKLFVNSKSTKWVPVEISSLNPRNQNIKIHQDPGDDIQDQLWWNPESDLKTEEEKEQKNTNATNDTRQFTIQIIINCFWI